jgi:hypothetical protein
MNKFFEIDVMQEGLPVRSWYEHLPLVAQDEIVNLLLHLKNLPMGLWRRPEFDPLDGEGGISELRADEVSSTHGVLILRIYGWRGHPDSTSYTFLHGTDKDESNDIDGKNRAKWRAEQLFVRNEARIHPFNFPS